MERNRAFRGGFALEKGLELLLYDVRRYRAAVARVFEKERAQEAPLEHKAAGAGSHGDATTVARMPRRYERGKGST